MSVISGNAPRIVENAPESEPCLLCGMDSVLTCTTHHNLKRQLPLCVMCYHSHKGILHITHAYGVPAKLTGSASVVRVAHKSTPEHFGMDLGGC